jgi:hypothetical protein
MGQRAAALRLRITSAPGSARTPICFGFASEDVRAIVETSEECALLSISRAELRGHGFSRRRLKIVYYDYENFAFSVLTGLDGRSVWISR